VPAAFGEQVPSCPGRSQRSQPWSQDDVQQKPSAQFPLAQLRVVEQVPPSGVLRTQTPLGLHQALVVQSLSAVQPVGQLEPRPSQRNGAQVDATPSARGPQVPDVHWSQAPEQPELQQIPETQFAEVQALAPEQLAPFAFFGRQAPPPQ
jgi:hypothetical protein